ncbi:MAG: hypothetical protein JO300_01540 [Silvibacterium sp.]|nr:hypothetical protein [Silvibacterium sp.]
MTGHNNRHLCTDCRESEYEIYAHARVHESMERNKQWKSHFRIGDWARWDYDLDPCTLTFSEAGRAKVVADFEAVGTVQGSQWEWAWGNRNLSAKCRSRITAVRDFGEEKGWAKLTTLFLESDEYLGWELTSIAAHILNADGTYRCPTDDKPNEFLYVVTFNTRFVN